MLDEEDKTFGMCGMHGGKEKCTKSCVVVKPERKRSL
jgi:hypothetical protein